MRTPTTQLGTAVRRRRKALRWTQSRLAGEVGRTLQWVSQIETGTRLTNEEVITELAEALTLPATDLIRLVQQDRVARGGAPPPPATLADSIRRWQESAGEHPGTREWALWISGRGFPPATGDPNDITSLLVSCATAGFDVVYCPIAASIGARTDSLNHAPWMAASTLQGGIDIMLHGGSTSEADSHLWLLAETQPTPPTSAAILAEFAQVLLILRSPRPEHTPSTAGPPPCDGDDIDVADAWIRIAATHSESPMHTWVRLGGDRSQQTYSLRHWLAAMQAQDAFSLSPLCAYTPANALATPPPTADPPADQQATSSG
ncbi:MAG: helix-turn-helix transcriptional regulator [Phycisphaerales bacterium]|nr:helix-turn-helix transcriptional regulator [Phycisphaerales bacterium]